MLGFEIELFKNNPESGSNVVVRDGQNCSSQFTVAVLPDQTVAYPFGLVWYLNGKYRSAGPSFVGSFVKLACNLCAALQN